MAKKARTPTTKPAPAEETPPAELDEAHDDHDDDHDDDDHNEAPPAELEQAPAVEASRAEAPGPRAKPAEKKAHETHPFAKRFRSRGTVAGHFCGNCKRPTKPVQPDHTYCAPCGCHWTVSAPKA